MNVIFHSARVIPHSSKYLRTRRPFLGEFYSNPSEAEVTSVDEGHRSLKRPFLVANSKQTQSSSLHLKDFLLFTDFYIKTDMPKRCVAANCSNVPSKSVRLYRFPREEALKKQWTRQVQRKRAEWTGPTAYSFICSEHFADDCFDTSCDVREQLGYGAKNSRNLLPNAVPTIFRRSETQRSSIKKRSRAAEKREHQQVRLFTCFLWPR